MFSKTNLISTLVTGLWAFFGGWILWGILGDSLIAGHLIADSAIMKTAPNFGPLVIGCLIVGFTFSIIYAKWANVTNSFSHGAQFGIWLGILVGFGNGLIDYATANIIDLTGMTINGLIYIIYFLIMGVLASMVYGKAKD